MGDVDGDTEELITGFSTSGNPVLVSPWQSGNAAFECNQAEGCGGDNAYKLVMVDFWQ
jgi:hypothetical protein